MKDALQVPWSQVNLGSIKRICCVHMPGVARDKGQEGRKGYTTLGPCNRIFYCDFRVYRMSVGLHGYFPWVPTYF